MLYKWFAICVFYSLDMYHFYTENVFDYTRNVFVAQHSSVIFSVRACADVFIALTHTPGVTTEKTYEIALGIEANSRSVIRGGVSQINMASAETPNILDCNEQK